jgi:hypothetical protein
LTAELFTPSELDGLIQTTVALWEGIDSSDLSVKQLELLGRARDAVRAEEADELSADSEVTALRLRLTREVWVLRRQDRHNNEVSLWADEDSGLHALAQYARENWDNVDMMEGVPAVPPAEDREAVDHYYGPMAARPDDDYDLYAEDISHREKTHLSLLGGHSTHLTDETWCAQANRAAVFHPVTREGALPAVTVEGVVTFSYLDPATRAVCVSVDVTTAADELVRPDGTIPLVIEVQNTVVFDATR